MHNTEVFQKILGLVDPWTVSSVNLDTEAGHLDIHLAHPIGTKFRCPECDRELGCYDHVPERRWRHLDTMHFRTVLHSKTPRVKCPEHGVKQVKLPWAEKNSRFTLFFERFAVDVLLATQTVQGAAGLLRTSWDATWNILQKAVSHGEAQKAETVIPPVGIDKKVFRKGQDISLICEMNQILKRNPLQVLKRGPQDPILDEKGSEAVPD